MQSMIISGTNIASQCSLGNSVKIMTQKLRIFHYLKQYKQNSMFRMMLKISNSVNTVSGGVRSYCILNFSYFM